MDIFKAILAIVLVIALIAGLGTFAFYPHSTEGQVVRVDYGFRSVSIEFEDGRKIRLTGRPNVSIIRGKHYRVKYNSFEYMYSVEELK